MKKIVFIFAFLFCGMFVAWLLFDFGAFLDLVGSVLFAGAGATLLIMTLIWKVKGKRDIQYYLDGGTILMFLALGGFLLWIGVEIFHGELIQSPEHAQFITRFIRPNNIDILQPGAEVPLREIPEVRGLRLRDSGWEHFARFIGPDDPSYDSIVAISRGGPGLGYHFNDVYLQGNQLVKGNSVGKLPYEADGWINMALEAMQEGRKLSGRKIFFDQNYEICDSVIFSSHPLSSAEFLVVIYDRSSSKAWSGQNLMVMCYIRKTSPLFEFFHG